MATPGNSQWKQIDESVETALLKRPRLTRLTICTPLDRQDPGYRTSTGSWTGGTRVNQWTAAAGTRAVDFGYWGQFEILERLAREENRGRTYFRFNAEVLTGDWFRARLDESIANAGARYTPELNVNLPIVHVFDGLGRRPEIFRDLKSQLRDIRKSHAGSVSPTVREIAPAGFDLLDADIARLREAIGAIPEQVGWIDWETIRHICTAAADHASGFTDLFGAEKRARRERAASQPKDSRHSGNGGNARAGTDSVPSPPLRFRHRLGSVLVHVSHAAGRRHVLTPDHLRPLHDDRLGA